MYSTTFLTSLLLAALASALPTSLTSAAATGNLTLFNGCSNAVYYSLNDSPRKPLGDSTPTLVLPFDPSSTLNFDVTGLGYPPQAILSVTFSDNSAAGQVSYGLNWIDGVRDDRLSATVVPSDLDCKDLNDEEGGEGVCEDSVQLVVELCGD